MCILQSIQYYVLIVDLRYFYSEWPWMISCFEIRCGVMWSFSFRSFFFFLFFLNDQKGRSHWSHASAIVSELYHLINRNLNINAIKCIINRLWNMSSYFIIYLMVTIYLFCLSWSNLPRNSLRTQKLVLWFGCKIMVDTVKRNSP